MSDVVAAVLMYHRIAVDGADRELLCVPPDEFRAHMRHLKDARYNVLPLEQIAEGLREQSLPPRAVAVTFDDGYLDSLTAAAPVLVEYELPASFFVVTAMHERPHEFWWDTLERALGDGSTTPPSMKIELGRECVELPTSTPDERRAARERVKRSFYGFDVAARDSVVRRIVEWSGEAAAPGDAASRAMSASESRELDRMPAQSVGSHTVNHLLLPAQSRETKVREIAESKRSLETLLRRPVTTLCYPYGGFDAEAIDIAREAGYTCAVSTGNLPVVADSDPFVIPRLAVRTGDDLADRLQSLLGTARSAA